MLTSGAATANPLLLKSNTTTDNQQYSTQELTQLTENQRAKQQALEQTATDFDVELSKLQQQLNQTKKPIGITREPFDIQINAAYSNIETLEREATQLKNELFTLKERQKKTLQAEIKETNKAYKNHLKLQINPESPDYTIRMLERAYLEQLLATLRVEQDTQNERLHLIMLRQELNSKQQKQQKDYIDQLNQRQKEQRNIQAEQVLQNMLPSDTPQSQHALMPLVQKNRLLGIELQKITLVINQTIDKQKKAEQEQAQIKQQTQSAEEQVKWMENNAVFGEALLQSLGRIPPIPSIVPLQEQLASIEVTKYDYQQKANELSQQLELKEYEKDLLPFLKAQNELLQKLITSFSTASTEIARLLLILEVNTLETEKLQALINEHLFWIRNAAPISLNWFKTLPSSFYWMLNNNHWQEMTLGALPSYSVYIWLIGVTLLIMLHDLLKKPYFKMLAKPSFKMSYLQKLHFAKVIRIFFASCFYAALLPFIVISAGLSLIPVSSPFVSALGAAILSCGILIFVMACFSQLSLHHGLLIQHFRINHRFLAATYQHLKRLSILALPCIALIMFTEYYTSSYLRHSIGRAALIIFCLVSYYFYYQILKSRKAYKDKTQEKQHVLERLVTISILLSPLVSIYLCLEGYYYSAFQVMKQLHISIAIAVIFIITYLFIRHWMVIQRRRLAFEMAKKKREEAAQKQANKNQTPHEALRDEILLEQAEASDLDAISKHALQLLDLFLCWLL